MNDKASMNDIEASLARARNPEKMYCPQCLDEMFSPMDKLSIGLFGKCSMHLEDDSTEVTNLLRIAEAI
jgi:hypothetical protein